MAQTKPNNTLQIWLTSICFGSLVIGAFAQFSAFLPYQIAIYFYLISYASGGYEGFLNTLKDLRNGELNIDFLMITAAIGAATLNQWTEGAILLFLFSLSGTLENYALGKSRTAIHSLLKLRPNKGLKRMDDGTEELVPIEDLKVGDIVIVKPGEHIPIDGNIVSGETTIDQSAITGESIPVSKQKGDTVFAATLNENGVIQVKVTKPAKDTTVAKIIELVESAQRNKAKTQRFLDTFEPRYAITVIVAVALLVIIPWGILDYEFESTFYRAMTVLVVASPCALIISTPASIISAIANGAKNGILFKGGAHVEQTVGIDIIAFDKTGTLTRGKPEVTNLYYFDHTLNQFSSDPKKIEDLLSIAAGCELHSEHHLAQAIVEKASELNVTPYEVENMQAIPGKGVKAQFNQMQLEIGNHTMFEQSIPNWSKIIVEKAKDFRAAGKTVVYVVKDKTPVGLVVLADKIRPAAKETIRQLRQLGIKEIVMLTGDNEGVANAIANELGIDQFHANLLPDQKVEKVEQLRQRGMVAMVGDGVNDAPALAISDLGIAMGAAGTDVALETADIVLMGDDLTKLPYLLQLSRKSRKVVWQNITFSMAVIIVLLFGVFLIDLPLTLGVVGHEGSTLLVVLNGLRLLRNSDLSKIPDI